MGNRKEQFIEKAIKVHGDKYDYSKVDYINSSTKVCIICHEKDNEGNEHGEFWQRPSEHLRNECPKCANLKRARFGRFSVQQFIDKAKEVHGDKYDYSKVNYINSSTKVCIICPEHGEFWMTPCAHIYSKQGCPKCKGIGLDNEEWIKKFKEVHGDKYDYSKVQYTNSKTKVCIICPEHGEFWQTPYKHYHKHQGCPKCGNISKGKLHRLTTEEFIEKSKKIHGDKYDYREVNYEKAKTKVSIICPEHGRFFITPNDHLSGHGCPKCGVIESRGENEIYGFLCGLIGKDNVIKHDRDVLGDGREIDIYLPQYKVGIEFDGLYWHSERKNKMKNYHLSKTVLCEENGIGLIHIFEDEYLQHKDILFNIFKRQFKKEDCFLVNNEGCSFKEIDRGTANIFLKENSLKEKYNAGKYIGCFYNNVLVSVMCFYKSSKEGEWIMSYVENNNYVCQDNKGLLNFFVKKYNPQKIITFVDRRFSHFTQKTVENLGFVLKKEMEPEYTYVINDKPTERINKYFFRKKSVKRKYNLPYNLTEKETREKLDLSKIWDCGKYRYEMCFK